MGGKGIICLTLHYFQIDLLWKGGLSCATYCPSAHSSVELSVSPSFSVVFELTSHFQSNLTNGIIKSVVGTKLEPPLLREGSSQLASKHTNAAWPASEQGTPYTGQQAGETGDIVLVMGKTSVPLQPLMEYLLAWQTHSVSDWLPGASLHTTPALPWAREVCCWRGGTVSPPCPALHQA